MLAPVQRQKRMLLCHLVTLSPCYFYCLRSLHTTGPRLIQGQGFRLPTPASIVYLPVPSVFRRIDLIPVGDPAEHCIVRIVKFHL